MARRAEIAKLAALALVRDAQRQAAELAVARSDKQLRSAEEQRRLAGERLAERQMAWSEAVAAPIFNLAQVGAWANAVLAGQGDLRQTNNEVVKAQQECGERRQAWSLASAKAEVAGALRRRAERHLSRRTEEGRLADQADRSARKMARS